MKKFLLSSGAASLLLATPMVAKETIESLKLAQAAAIALEHNDAKAFKSNIVSPEKNNRNAT